MTIPHDSGSTHNIFFDGSDDEVREHLESVLATDAFLVRGARITVELPLTGVDKRPRPSGETVLVTFEAPENWSIQAPERGVWWHVVAEGADTTLCTISLASWRGETRRDDEHAISCPWCRVRMIAIEVAAPPSRTGRRDPPKRTTLHDEIARILTERGNEWMTTDELARAVNGSGLYKKQDGSPVTAFQIHGRTRNYQDLFERDRSRVRLRH